MANNTTKTRYFIMNITTRRPLRYNERYGGIVYYDTYEDAYADLEFNEKVVKEYYTP